MNELISIVVAVYNAENTINRCVNSIIAQTYKNIEIILVNDGSTDKSELICEDFRRKDPRIIVINKKNAGLTSARKEGYKRAKGLYIVFIDSDDYLNSLYIERHYKNILENQADMSICSYILKTKNQEIPINFQYSSNPIDKELFVRELILPRVYKLSTDVTSIPDFLWLRMFKTSLIHEDCFVSEREVYTEDVFFNFEYLKRCNRIAILEDCLYYYYQNPSSLTHIYRSNKAEMEFKRVALLREFLRFYNSVDEMRLSMTMFKVLWGCVENASYLNKFIKFKRELIPIFENMELKAKLEKIDENLLTKGEKVIYFTYKHKIYFLLYIYKKLLRGYLKWHF